MNENNDLDNLWVVNPNCYICDGTGNWADYPCMDCAEWFFKQLVIASKDTERIEQLIEMIESRHGDNQDD